MPVHSNKIIAVKLFIIAVTAVVGLIGLTKYSEKYERVQASASGPTASHTNAPGESSCTACHTDFSLNSGSGMITVLGIPANYLPNQQVPVTVRVSQADAVVFGFQLTALDSTGRQAGTFALPNQSPQPLQIADGFAGGFPRQYIEHTINGIVPSTFGTKSWTFLWTAPAQRVGKIGFYAAGNAANSDGGTSGDYIYTTSKNTLSGSAIANFDADGKSDIAVWRPSDGVWYSLNSTNGRLKAAQFGAAGDKIVAGDYDGDGTTDYAVWRPSIGTWFVSASTAGFTSMQFGTNGDIPVAGDFDGDLKTDYAVYRPSNGTWYLQRSASGFTGIQFGISSDIPVPADYDGDSKTDVAVYRGGEWYILKSRDGFSALQFGVATDKPVMGDYDGDGKNDIAVYRPSNGTWYVQRSASGFTGIQFGISADKPAPADYDGDGKTDVAVFRNGDWYVLKSADNTFYGVGFGTATDVPVPGN